MKSIFIFAYLQLFLIFLVGFVTAQSIPQTQNSGTGSIAGSGYVPDSESSSSETSEETTEASAKTTYASAETTETSTEIPVSSSETVETEEPDNSEYEISCPFPTDLKEGTRVKPVGSNKLYLILDGKRRNVPTKATNLRLFEDTPRARILDECVFDQIPLGNPIAQGAHLAIGSGGKRIFLVYGGVKRHICNEKVYAAFHFRGAKPRPNMGSLTMGPPICSTAIIRPDSQ